MDELLDQHNDHSYCKQPNNSKELVISVIDVCRRTNACNRKSETSNEVIEEVTSSYFVESDDCENIWNDGKGTSGESNELQIIQNDVSKRKRKSTDNRKIGKGVQKTDNKIEESQNIANATKNADTYCKDSQNVANIVIVKNTGRTGKGRPKVKYYVKQIENKIEESRKLRNDVKRTDNNCKENKELEVGFEKTDIKPKVKSEEIGKSVRKSSRKSKKSHRNGNNANETVNDINDNKESKKCGKEIKNADSKSKENEKIHFIGGNYGTRSKGHHNIVKDEREADTESESKTNQGILRPKANTVNTKSNEIQIFRGLVTDRTLRSSRPQTRSRRQLLEQKKNLRVEIQGNTLRKRSRSQNSKADDNKVKRPKLSSEEEEQITRNFRTRKFSEKPKQRTMSLRTRNCQPGKNFAQKVSDENKSSGKYKPDSIFDSSKGTGIVGNKKICVNDKKKILNNNTLKRKERNRNVFCRKSYLRNLITIVKANKEVTPIARPKRSIAGKNEANTKSNSRKSSNISTGKCSTNDKLRKDLTPTSKLETEDYDDNLKKSETKSLQSKINEKSNLHSSDGIAMSINDLIERKILKSERGRHILFNIDDSDLSTDTADEVEDDLRFRPDPKLGLPSVEIEEDEIVEVPPQVHLFPSSDGKPYIRPKRRRIKKRGKKYRYTFKQELTPETNHSEENICNSPTTSTVEFHPTSSNYLPSPTKSPDESFHLCVIESSVCSLRNSSFSEYEQIIHQAFDESTFARTSDESPSDDINNVHIDDSRKSICNQYHRCCQMASQRRITTSTSTQCDLNEELKAKTDNKHSGIDMSVQTNRIDASTQYELVSGKSSSPTNNNAQTQTIVQVRCQLGEPESITIPCVILNDSFNTSTPSANSSFQLTFSPPLPPKSLNNKVNVIAYSPTISTSYPLRKLPRKTSPELMELDTIFANNSQICIKSPVDIEDSSDSQLKFDNLKNNADSDVSITSNSSQNEIANLSNNDKVDVDAALNLPQNNEDVASNSIDNDTEIMECIDESDIKGTPYSSENNMTTVKLGDDIASLSVHNDTVNLSCINEANFNDISNALQNDIINLPNNDAECFEAASNSPLIDPARHIDNATGTSNLVCNDSANLSTNATDIDDTSNSHQIDITNSANNIGTNIETTSNSSLIDMENLKNNVDSDYKANPNSGQIDTSNLEIDEPDIKAKSNSLHNNTTNLEKKEDSANIDLTSNSPLVNISNFGNDEVAITKKNFSGKSQAKDSTSLSPFHKSMDDYASLFMTCEEVLVSSDEEELSQSGNYLEMEVEEGDDKVPSLNDLNDRNLTDSPLIMSDKMSVHSHKSNAFRAANGVFDVSASTKPSESTSESCKIPKKVSALTQDWTNSKTVCSPINHQRSTASSTFALFKVSTDVPSQSIIIKDMKRILSGTPIINSLISHSHPCYSTSKTPDASTSNISSPSVFQVDSANRTSISHPTTVGMSRNAEKSNTIADSHPLSVNSFLQSSSTGSSVISPPTSTMNRILTLNTDTECDNSCTLQTVKNILNIPLSLDMPTTNIQIGAPCLSQSFVTSQSAFQNTPIIQTVTASPIHSKLTEPSSSTTSTNISKDNRTTTYQILNTPLKLNLNHDLTTLDVPTQCIPSILTTASTPIKAANQSKRRNGQISEISNAYIKNDILDKNLQAFVSNQNQILNSPSESSTQSVSFPIVSANLTNTFSSFKDTEINKDKRDLSSSSDHSLYTNGKMNTKALTVNTVHSYPLINKHKIKTAMSETNLQTAVINEPSRIVTQTNAEPQVLNISIQDKVKPAGLMNALVKCDVCKKYFSDTESLKKHIESAHRDEIEYNIKINSDHTEVKINSDCNKVKLVSDLKVKKRLPVKCTICAKTFKRETDMKWHLIKFHTVTDPLLAQSRKPHKCAICSKVFNFHSHLNDHLKTHMKIQLIQCPLCPKAFGIVDCFRNHFWNVHGKEGWFVKAGSNTIFNSSIISMSASNNRPANAPVMQIMSTTSNHPDSSSSAPSVFRLPALNKQPQPQPFQSNVKLIPQTVIDLLSKLNTFKEWNASLVWVPPQSMTRNAVTVTNSPISSANLALKNNTLVQVMPHSNNTKAILNANQDSNSQSSDDDELTFMQHQNSF